MMPDIVDPVQVGPQLLDLGTEPGEIAEWLVPMRRASSAWLSPS